MGDGAGQRVYFVAALILSTGCGGKTADANDQTQAPHADAAPNVLDGGTGEDTSSETARDGATADENAPPPSEANGSVTIDAGAAMAELPAPNADAGPVVVTLIDPPTDCEAPYTSQIPRLSNEQYGNTVRDLVGVTALTAFDGAAPTTLLAPDTAGPVDQAVWAGYGAAAAAIARQVMGNTTQRAAFLGCETIDATCLHDGVIAFGRRAFRRPLTAIEVARFDELLARGSELTATGSGEELAQVLLETFLISPSFLQRAEMTEGVQTGSAHIQRSGHELAARLSYAFWNSMPDPELDAAADAGQLSTYEQLFAQAERMLADDKARDMLASMHRRYLHMQLNSSSNYWTTSNKDPELFPEYTAATADRARQETELFFDHVVFVQRGSFADLFTSGAAFVNQDTAPIYELNPADYGVNPVLVDLPADERPGFLTRVGFLASYSSPRHTSPVLRGKFILQDLLGITVGPPDPVAVTTPVPDLPELDTVRKRLSAQTSGVECSSCHALLNPLGFVLEAYNAVGRAQSVDAETGAPIDTSAEVILDPGTSVTVANPAELMAELAVAPNARRQYVRNWVTQTFDRPVDGAECIVEHLTTRFSSEQSIVELLPYLTLESEFTWRKQEPSP